MSVTPASHSPSSILAVVVLYNCDLAQSQSASSLIQILRDDTALAKHFSLLVYDNSPRAQSLALPVGLSAQYVHDPSNGGLAAAYNLALERAEANDDTWLLLLDQDTSLTHEFLVELVESAANLYPQSTVAAIVPKLLVHGKVYSPASPLIDQMRHQFQRPKQLVGPDIVGIQHQPLVPYNSGSAIRVSSLRSIGGFPPEFWLDFLDHAVYGSLFVHGYRIYVMRATLVHESSYADVGSMPLWRLQNVLIAQTLHVKRRGNFMDKLLYRIWLLRHSRNLRRGCKDPRMWREAVLQAFLLRVPKGPRPGFPSPQTPP